jgi:hypothetical protein
MVLFRPATLNRYLYTTDDPINDTDSDGSTAASVIRDLTCRLVFEFGSLRGQSAGTVLPGCPSPPDASSGDELLEGGISGQTVNNNLREAQGLKKDAVELAKMALGTESCSKHFSGQFEGRTPTQMMDYLGGTIGFRFNLPSNVGARTIISGRGADGKGTRAQILISTKETDKNSWLLTDDIGRAALLLHELTHAYNDLRGLNSDLKHGENDPAGNFAVSNTILKDCFNASPRFGGKE